MPEVVTEMKERKEQLPQKFWPRFNIEKSYKSGPQPPNEIKISYCIAPESYRLNQIKQGGQIQY